MSVPSRARQVPGPAAADTVPDPLDEALRHDKEPADLTAEDFDRLRAATRAAWQHEREEDPLARTAPARAPAGGR